VASARSGRNLRQLQALFDVGTMAVLTDGQLLDRFVAGPGEVAELAFAALLERHGPMVMRTCIRALRNPHEAEDAFQATFLVLARRAESIRLGDSVACWLHGVALRVAANERALMDRRRLHERRKAEATTTILTPGPEADDLGRALQEEFARLPARLRDAAVLVFLEGCTHEEAASRLGRPVATVRSRLATARERLKGRLTRRGLAPAALATALTAEAGAAKACLPARLVEATIRLGIGYAAGDAAAGVGPAGVAALTAGVLKAMMIQKLKTLAMATVAVSLIGISVGRGQTGGSSGPQRDRLGEMEKKLDRLLEVMGDPTRRATTTSHDPFQQPTQAATPGITVVDTASPGAMVKMPVATSPGDARITSQDMFTRDTRSVRSIPIQDIDRVARLEQRIVTIERLLAEQGRRLGALEQALKSSATMPVPAPGAVSLPK
jgi:RNA polymerase sigma factor (sigma-70 family)